MVRHNFYDKGAADKLLTHLKKLDYASDATGQTRKCLWFSARGQPYDYGIVNIFKHYSSSEITF